MIDVNTDLKEGKVFVTIPLDILNKIIILVGDNEYKLSELINVFDYQEFLD